MNLRRKEIEYLEGDAIPPSQLRKEAVEAYAQTVAEAVGFKVGRDLRRLVLAFGGRLHHAEMDTWIDEDGSIFVHGESDFDIVLPYYTSPLRDNFTVGHELGHYFLHSDQGGTPVVAYRKGSTRIEWEANWFSAALLMPRDEFAKVWLRHKDLALVASHFKVSEDAARVRKNVLNL